MLQHQKSHVADVVDDFGGTLGIVTMEDMLALRGIQQERSHFIVKGERRLDLSRPSLVIMTFTQRCCAASRSASPESQGWVSPLVRL